TRPDVDVVLDGLLQQRKCAMTILNETVFTDSDKARGPGTVHSVGYEQSLAMLSDGSVHRSFDPFLDIDWNAPENRLDPQDRRWILHPAIEPLGATAWYQAQPEDRQIEIGRWRLANSVRVGAAFESVLIRGLMHY